MFLNLRDVNCWINSPSSIVQVFIDPYTYKNYYALELLDLSEDVKSRLIKAPKLFDIYETQMLFEFLEQNEFTCNSLSYALRTLHRNYRALMKSPEIITGQRTEYIDKFIENKRNVHPELVQFMERVDDETFINHCLHFFTFADECAEQWDEFTELFLLKYTTEWCLESKFPFKYIPGDKSMKLEVCCTDEKIALQIILNVLENRGIPYEQKQDGALYVRI